MTENTEVEQTLLGSIPKVLPHEMALTLEQGGKFQSLQIPFDNVGIMSGSFMDEQVGIIFAEDEGKIEPLAMVLDKEFMARFRGELLDMHGNEVVSQMAESRILDPSTLDSAMMQSIMSGITGGSK